MAARVPIRWTGNQVARLKRAVSQYNAAVTRLRNRYGDSVQLPPKTTFDEQRSRIYSRQDLYRIERSLLRILKKNNPSGQEVTPRGNLRYVEQEARYTKQRIQRQRERVRNEVAIQSYGAGWEEITPRQRLKLMSDSNLSNIKGEYYTVEELEALRNMEYRETDPSYFNQYIDALWNTPGWEPVRAEVTELIRSLMSIPGALREVLESKYIETQITYLYPWAPGSDEMVKAVPALLRFWRDMVSQYGVGRNG